MALLPACTQPVALANSVKKSSGGPAWRTTWRKTTSVTASIGAKAKNGRGRVSQKVIALLYHGGLCGMPGPYRLWLHVRLRAKGNPRRGWRG